MRKMANLTDEYLEKVLGTFKREHVDVDRQGSRIIKIRVACPICGPGQKKAWKKSKKCAVFMPSTKCAHDWVFRCCRCTKESINFPNYLKKQHPKLFREYHLKRDQEGSTGKGFNMKKLRGPLDDYQPKFGG